MATLHEPAPRRRTRRFWLVLTGFLLLVALTGFCLWWLALKSVSDEMRPFVGTWRLENVLSLARPEVVGQRELLPDGTIREQVWDSRTGAFLYDQPGLSRWRVSNGRFQEVVGGNALLDLLGMSSGTKTLRDVVVTWEGPDRFQYPGYTASRPVVIWVRCDRTGRR